MSMTKEIEARIRDAINVTDFKLVNQSHLHEGHASHNGSGETHFAVTIVSSDFQGLSRLQAQRLVMSAVKPLFAKGLHAFSIKTQTKT